MFKKITTLFNRYLAWRDQKEWEERELWRLHRAIEHHLIYEFDVDASYGILTRYIASMREQGFGLDDHAELSFLYQALMQECVFKAKHIVEQCPAASVELARTSDIDVEEYSQMESWGVALLAGISKKEKPVDVASNCLDLCRHYSEMVELEDLGEADARRLISGAKLLPAESGS